MDWTMKNNNFPRNFQVYSSAFKVWQLKIFERRMVVNLFYPQLSVPSLEKLNCGRETGN